MTPLLDKKNIIFRCIEYNLRGESDPYGGHFLLKWGGRREGRNGGSGLVRFSNPLSSQLENLTRSGQVTGLPSLTVTFGF